MRINEVVMREAVYPGMMWLHEAYLFFTKAPENLQQEVEDMLENDQEDAAKKVIAEFLGITAEGHVAELNENPEAISTLKQTISDPYTDPKTRKIAQQKLAKFMKDLDSKKSDPKFQKRAQLAKKKFTAKPKVWDLSSEGVSEAATAGATSAGNIASLLIGEIPKDQKAWAGSPGKMGKGPKPVKAKKQGPKDNAINRNANLFSGEPIKRQ